MVDTNVTAVAILTKLFTAGMVERNRGHIINISSVAAHHAYPGKQNSRRSCSQDQYVITSVYIEHGSVSALYIMWDCRVML